MNGSYDCMTPEELAFWRSSANSYVKATVPCIDCPVAFHLQEKAAGRCNRETAASTGRPPGPQHRVVMHDKKHRQLREASRRYRQRHGSENIKAWKRRLRDDVEAIRAARTGVQ